MFGVGFGASGGFSGAGTHGAGFGEVFVDSGIGSTGSSFPGFGFSGTRVLVGISNLSPRYGFFGSDFTSHAGVGGVSVFVSGFGVSGGFGTGVGVGFCFSVQ